MYTAEQKALAFEIVARHNGKVSEDAVQDIRDILQLPELRRETVWRWINSLPVAKPVAPKTQPQLQQTTEKATTEILPPIPLFVPRESPKSMVMTRASQGLDDIFEETARKYLDHALHDDVVRGTKGQQAVMAAAIAVDKMRLLRGLPTEIVSILPGLVAAMQDRGFNPALVFQAMYDKLQLPERTIDHAQS